MPKYPNSLCLNSTKKKTKKKIDFALCFLQIKFLQQFVCTLHYYKYILHFYKTSKKTYAAILKEKTSKKDPNIGTSKHWLGEIKMIQG